MFSLRKYSKPIFEHIKEKDAEKYEQLKKELAELGIEKLFTQKKNFVTLKGQNTLKIIVSDKREKISDLFC